MPNIADSIDAVNNEFSNYFPVPISVREYHTDSISPSGDVDIYQISLLSSPYNYQHYQFSVTGLSEVEGNGDLVFDPTLTLYDPNGNQVRYDDDAGPGFDAYIEFWPASEGLYTLEVAGSGTETGAYGVYTNLWVLG
jgi:hypothetical protein